MQEYCTLTRRELSGFFLSLTGYIVIAAAAFLKGRPETNGKLGAVGFCYGGGMVNYLATQLRSDLSAGVAFYGSAPDLEDVPKIKAPLLIQSAENDDRISGHGGGERIPGCRWRR